jgi:hypothetical protein
MKIFTVGLTFCVATTACSQTFPPTLAERVGCILKVNAYIAPPRSSDPKHTPLSRYDLRLFQPANTPYKWDFTLPHNPDFPYTVLIGGYGAPDYRTQKQTTVRATLRQFDTLEEIVTFKNLDLAPSQASPESRFTMRVLSLPEARSFTTPSGITVTLPAQSYGAMPPVLRGNPNALFIRIEISPNTKLLSSLPDSPLWRKHRRPVSLQLGQKVKVYGVDEIRYNDDATPNYGRVSMSIPNLKTAMHLDELTFVVRQRINLQVVPVAIKVPISKPTPRTAHVKRS